MNLNEFFTDDKMVQTKNIFKAAESATAIKIKSGGELKEHITTIAAMLVCITGGVVFENENGIKEMLLPGDYISIEPGKKHWINADKDSTLLLIK